jgi:DNA-3-methyladenine glycosylase II
LCDFGLAFAGRCGYGIRMSTVYYKKVRGHLSANCPVMKQIIARVGACRLTPRNDDAFTLLVRCVIGQQISGKAAESISGKLLDMAGGSPIPVAKLAKFTEAKYKSCGISGPKQRTLRAVIEHVQANPELLPSIPDLEDEAIREQLTVIKGIGPWTADMFMIFGLGRPDVWAVGDYGIKVAVKKHFRLRKLPDAAKLTKIARPWEPYRSVASWYPWQSLDAKYRDEET